MAKTKKTKVSKKMPMMSKAEMLKNMGSKGMPMMGPDMAMPFGKKKGM